jgi:hypothetical protein
VAIIIVLVRLAGGSSPAGPAAATEAPTADSTSPVSSTGSATIPVPRVSSAFAGTWAGPVQQPGPAGVVLDVRITLAQGATQGAIAYSGAGGFSCSGQVAVQAAPGGRLQLAQGIVTGQKQCGNGVVTLSGGTSAASLGFAFNGSGGPALTGTLSRQQPPR